MRTSLAPPPPPPPTNSALLALLPMRRARPIVWAVYAPLSVLGVALFFYHRPHDVWAPLPFFEPRFIVMRILYIANFLASSLNAQFSLLGEAGPSVEGLAAVSETVTVVTSR